jgi:hypothetical protein
MEFSGVTDSHLRPHSSPAAASPSSPSSAQASGGTRADRGREPRPHPCQLLLTLDPSSDYMLSLSVGPRPPWCRCPSSSTPVETSSGSPVRPSPACSTRASPRRRVGIPRHSRRVPCASPGCALCATFQPLRRGGVPARGHRDGLLRRVNAPVPAPLLCV